MMTINSAWGLAALVTLSATVVGGLVSALIVILSIKIGARKLRK